MDVIGDDMPRDADFDDVPDEIRERSGPITIGGFDPDMGKCYETPITIEELAAGLADGRRLREDEDA